MAVQAVPVRTPVLSNEYPIAKVFAYYLQLKGEIATQKVDGSFECRKGTHETNLVAQILKVVTWVASCGILPLVAFLFLYTYRQSHEFHWEAPAVQATPVPAGGVAARVQTATTPAVVVPADDASQQLINQMLQEDLDGKPAPKVAEVANGAKPVQDDTERLRAARAVLADLPKKEERTIAIAAELAAELVKDKQDHTKIGDLTVEQDKLDADFESLKKLTKEELALEFTFARNNPVEAAALLERVGLKDTKLVGVDLVHAIRAGLKRTEVRAAADAARAVVAAQDAEYEEAIAADQGKAKDVNDSMEVLQAYRVSSRVIKDLEEAAKSIDDADTARDNAALVKTLVDRFELLNKLTVDQIVAFYVKWNQTVETPKTAAQVLNGSKLVGRELVDKLEADWDAEHPTEPKPAPLPQRRDSAERDAWALGKFGGKQPVLWAPEEIKPPSPKPPVNPAPPAAVAPAPAAPGPVAADVKPGEDPAAAERRRKRVAALAGK